MNRSNISDSKSFVVGYSEDDTNEIRYFGFTKGYVGRYDKASGFWYWMSGPRVGKMGPRGDIGYSEVLRAEGKY